MSILYHYSNNYKCFNVLENKSIRMSDIRKSNDYMEMELFYPEIIFKILEIYLDKPFDFKYGGKTNVEAIKELLFITKHMIDTDFEEGYVSNFVTCFSEKSDLLSQWRGYADDGKGCCLGFSKKELEAFCEKSGNVLRLEKVKYLSKQEVMAILIEEAKRFLEELKNLRQWIVDNMTYDDEDPETDSLLEFNFYSMIEDFLNDSLRFKSKVFSEEKEWRLFFQESVNKNPKWLVSNQKAKSESNWVDETIEFLKPRIRFNISENDIMPYVSIQFSEFKKCQ